MCVDWDLTNCIIDMMSLEKFIQNQYDDFKIYWDDDSCSYKYDLIPLRDYTRNQLFEAFFMREVSIDRHSIGTSAYDGISWKDKSSLDYGHLKQVVESKRSEYIAHISSIYLLPLLKEDQIQEIFHDHYGAIFNRLKVCYYFRVPEGMTREKMSECILRFFINYKFRGAYARYTQEHSVFEFQA